jgi:two-component system sensor histidine kinase MprB
MKLSDIRSFAERELTSFGLRTRIAVLAAGSVAVAVLLVAGGAWFVARQELVGGVRQQLQERAAFIQRSVQQDGLDAFAFPFHGRIGFLTEVVDSSGNIVIPLSPDGESFPVDEKQRAVAASDVTAKGTWSSINVTGDHLIVRTLPLGGDRAVVVALPVNAIDNALTHFAWLLFVLSVLGVAGAAVVGRLVARSAIRPVERLTQAAEHVARTQDLDASIEVDRSDELGRLGATFNAMLEALAQSRDQQQRLIHDASHELRTPLTSLRTNIEMLSRETSIPEDERARILSDLNVEIGELTDLVSELVDLATASGGTDEEVTDVRLDEIVADVAERARRRTGQTIDVDAAPVVVRVRPVRIERAVSNIIDNACKWNPHGMPVEVALHGGRFEVADRGPGIDAEDLPFVFDRFYRASKARALPGSGLGLAIVKHVVEEAGGRVFAHPRDGGGAVVGFELPVGEPIATDEPNEPPRGMMRTP